jgi:DNA-binding response OmpR family regulator
MAPRVLLVEADCDVAHLYRVLLEYGGYVIQWAADCRSALVVASDGLSSQPHLVLIDPWLPDGDGLALCGELKARWPSVPVIALSTQPALRERLLGACADEFLLKPFDIDEFDTAVQRVVTRASRRSESAPEATPTLAAD